MERNVDQEIQLLQKEIKKKKDSQDDSEKSRPFTTKKVTEKQLDQAVDNISQPVTGVAYYIAKLRKSLFCSVIGRSRAADRERNSPENSRQV